MFQPHLLSRQQGRLRSRVYALCIRRHLSDHASKDPLKILFCGADEFSIFSLRALHKLQRTQPESIASIDVVCRPDKRVGRGLKNVQQVPIKTVAHELDLPLHQIDTFTGWSPPSAVDLVVAVSFGLLVPPRILKFANHGGLNVHPSLLPDLRGPAPIQHALLQNRSFTGVTLQTMHPTRFDHGRILDQTPSPGIPIATESTPFDLIAQLGPIGAEMLSRGIVNWAWSEQDSRTTSTASALPEGTSHAPKITPEDRHIDWTTWTADQIVRYDRVIGRLWDTVSYQRCHADPTVQSKRITFEGPWRKIPPSNLPGDRIISARPGSPHQLQDSASLQTSVAFVSCDGYLASPRTATIEGGVKNRGIQTLSHALKSHTKPPGGLVQ